MSSLRKILVTGLGTGYLPVAPGTWGSAAVCGIFLLICLGADGRALCVGGTLAVLMLLSAVACVALGRFAERAFGHKDARQCTADEWAGQAAALFGLPLGGGGRDWLITAAAAFVAFRLFDIVKPPPVRRLERLPAGWGVLADDLMAGAYANLACQLLLRLWVLA